MVCIVDLFSCCHVMLQLGLMFPQTFQLNLSIGLNLLDPLTKMLTNNYIEHN